MTSVRSRPFHQVVAVAAAASPVIDARTATIMLPLVLDALLDYYDENHVTPQSVRDLAEKDAFYAAACYGYARCCKVLGLEAEALDLNQARKDAKQALNASLTAAAVAYRQA